MTQTPASPLARLEDWKDADKSRLVRIAAPRSISRPGDWVVSLEGPGIPVAVIAYAAGYQTQANGRGHDNVVVLFDADAEPEGVIPTLEQTIAAAVDRWDDLYARMEAGEQPEFWQGRAGGL